MMPVNSKNASLRGWMGQGQMTDVTGAWCCCMFILGTGNHE
jgi:hypothetical protein